MRRPPNARGWQRRRPRVRRDVAQSTRSVGGSDRSVRRRALALTARGRAMSTKAAMVERGRQVLRMESDALAALSGRLGDEFARAVALIKACPPGGRVIVSGLGKSGLVGR